MKRLLCLPLILVLVCYGSSAFAQRVTVTGTVKNASTSEAVPAVSVTVKDGTGGTFTDDNGNFSLSVEKLPVTLIFSSVNFESQEVAVSSTDQPVDISFVPASSLGQEVVVSASRTAERIIESPVTVERVSARAIRNAPASSYYDIVANVKGVDLTASSLTFKTPSTRGFNGSGNLRFNQLVDGMDNQAPGLNFAVGSIVGLSELDVESMELLPGASSALYGPGGMNGTLLINSKNPFKYQGLSVQIKQGIMHTDGKYRNPSPYYNWSARWAEKIGEKFAFKITTELISAKDWVAADYRNYSRVGTTSGSIIPGTRESDPNYDGVNVYGDETTADIRQVLNGVAQQAPFLAPYINTLTGSPINVSRTGYKESDVVDPYTINYKLGGAMHYKLSSKLEAIAEGFWGTGNTVYTGSDRYSLRDLKMAQYKLELNHKNWFLRAYTTQENAGQSYNATITTRLFNEAWKPSGGSTGWFAQYGQTFLAAKLAGASDMQAHAQARSVADQGRPLPGSAQFKQIYDKVRSIPISEGGGKFVDKTDLYNYEGQYNFTHLTGDFAEILVGGNYKKYVLNSEGTLFADSTGTIGINEVGAYAQISKELFNEVVKLTVSGRYDKNQNFKGRFTPRATALIRVAKDNNIRLSFQTAYRFPSTQQQWINLSVGGGSTILIGGLPEMINYYNLNGRPAYSVTSIQAGTPQQQTFTEAFKPESVTSYEVGYKGLWANGKLLFDAYGYLGQYQDFIVRVNVARKADNSVPSITDLTNGGATVISVPLNTSSQVKTYGWGASLDYRFANNFSITGNFSSDVLDNVPVGYVAFFNSPKYRANLSFGNTGFGPHDALAFNVVYRWQDGFFYESDFISGQIEPIQLLDAQFSYKLPNSKSVFKIGGNNILNQYYRNAAGNPSIGGLYYVSYGYNLF